MRASLFLIVLGIVAVAVVTFLLLRNSRSGRTQTFHPAEFQPGPIRHQQLSEVLNARIRKFEPIFTEGYPRSHEEWLDGFKRDANSEQEIAHWGSYRYCISKFHGETDADPRC